MKEAACSPLAVDTMFTFFLCYWVRLAHRVARTLARKTQVERFSDAAVHRNQRPEISGNYIQIQIEERRMKNSENL